MTTRESPFSPLPVLFRQFRHGWVRSRRQFGFPVLADTIPQSGRLTQRLECHPYKVEVRGSNPLSPIAPPKAGAIERRAIESRPWSQTTTSQYLSEAKTCISLGLITGLIARSFLLSTIAVGSRADFNFFAVIQPLFQTSTDLPFTSWHNVSLYPSLGSNE
jgi:hypothetical protein